GLDLTSEQLAQALDPRRFIEMRVGLGGVSPQATARLLQNQFAQLAQDETWHQQAQARLANAELLRTQEAHAYWAKHTKC
ncbi:MAG: hypothetical protein KDE47_29485, partial [Caldilineaceae bacterium]|nr:hypothetical protein [Caldilineaceae bacterium]